MDFFFKLSLPVNNLVSTSLSSRKAVGIGLAAFGEGLAVFGAAMMAAAPEVLVGELLLAGFGAALIPLTYALSLLSPLIDSFGKIIIGVFSAIPPIITAMSEGFEVQHWGLKVLRF